jgi:CubicO group peptidase (beta-lactamase class C family)
MLKLLVFCAAAPLFAQSGMEAVFAPLDIKGPGAAVLVLKNGKPIFERGYGVRDLRGNAKITSGTNFRLASFSKQFTAMAAMISIRDKRFTYESRLTDFFPDFPAWGKAITVRHLLTHTSGLPDYEDLMGQNWTAEKQITDKEVLELLKKEKAPKFAPGASWSYSNSGYVVLGLIIAQKGFEPFPDFLKRFIFDPLRMKHTITYVKGTNSVTNRAYGHVARDGAFLEADQSSTSATLGDGGIYSNLDDLEKWDEALRKNTLLSKNDFAPALIPVRLNNGALPPHGVSYGFGWYLDPHKGRPRMWHTGETLGFRTVIERFTDEELTIIVLANRADLDVDKLALQAADLMDAREVAPRK